MSEYNGEKSSQDFSATFVKKPGILEKSIAHEHIYISTLIWKYSLEEFCVSSNNENFASFGDVVIEVKTENQPKKETYALNFQLSPGKNTLKIKDLTLENGNFNVKKYIEEIKSFEEDTKAFIYTDANFSACDGQKIVLDSDTCILIWKELSDWRIANGGIYIYRIQVKKSDEDLGSLYLYCGQKNVKKLKETSLERFKTRLNSDDSSYDRFVNFIYNWSKIEGKKEKLTKRVIKRAATLSVLTPFIKPLSFSSAPVSKNVKLLREAISKFDVTLIDEESCHNVKNLWSDAKKELINNLKKVNRLRTRYQIMPEPIKTIEDCDGKDEECSKLLWLLGKCPLVVCGNEKTFGAIYLHIQDKFVVMSTNTRFDYCTKFHKLADLEVEPEIYENVLVNFKCSLGGEKESLKDVIGRNKEMKDAITVNELVQMAFEVTSQE